MSKNNGLDTAFLMEDRNRPITTEDLYKILYEMDKKSSMEGNSRFLNLKKNISIIWKLVLAFAFVGGIIWSAATLAFSKMDEDKADKIHKEQGDRIHQIEKNDIEQTTILKEIKKSVDKLAQ